MFWALRFICEHGLPIARLERVVGAGATQGGLCVTETGRIIGVSCALTGFSVALAAGLLTGNAPHVVLGRGVVALIACRMVGGYLGMLAERVVAESGSASIRARAPGQSEPVVVGDSTGGRVGASERLAA